MAIVTSFTRNIGGQILSYEASSLMNKLPVIVRGSGPITQRGHLTVQLVPLTAFTFWKTLLTGQLCKRVTKSRPCSRVCVYKEQH